MLKSKKGFAATNLAIVTVVFEEDQWLGNSSVENFMILKTKRKYDEKTDRLCGVLVPQKRLTEIWRHLIPFSMILFHLMKHSTGTILWMDFKKIFHCPYTWLSILYSHTLVPYICYKYLLATLLFSREELHLRHTLYLKILMEMYYAYHVLMRG